MTNNPRPVIRVLVVDDMAQVRRDLCTVLPLAGDAAGYQIEIVGEATNGREAIQRAAGLHPDVVLMDLVMPVLDGFAAAQVIKASNPLIRVVVLTVMNPSTPGVKAHISDVDGFIEKGAPLSELVEAIAN